MVDGPVMTPELDRALRRPIAIVDDCIRLRGTPGDLVGVVQLRRAEHPGEAAFKIATTDIAETAFGYHQRLNFAPLLRASLPVDRPMPSTLSFRAMPSAGNEGPVPVAFSVDPLTPPGKYEATFDIAGEEQPAEIEVLPVERLEVAPRAISISGAPGETVRETLVLTNRGNVALELDLLGMLVLQEEEQVCLSIQRALGAVKKGEDGKEPYEQFLNALANSLAERKTDFGRVRLADGAITLGPGETRQVTAGIQLPRDLVAGRYYRALLKARRAQLFVEITALAGGKPSAAGRAKREEE